MERTDNRKNTRENGRPLEQPRADADNWRKPVEPPKLDVPASNLAKGASALELAQGLFPSPGTTCSSVARSRNILGQPGPTHRQINSYWIANL